MDRIVTQQQLNYGGKEAAPVGGADVGYWPNEYPLKEAKDGAGVADIVALPRVFLSHFRNFG